MTRSPNPLNLGNLTRASRIGIAVAVIGIALFLVVWIILESTGIDQVPRIIISICLPPALIAMVAGGYFLLIPSRNQDNG